MSPFQFEIALGAMEHRAKVTQAHHDWLGRDINTGRNSDFDADTLAYALLAPHPKMNFALSQREAIDVAAYLSTLAR
jgi:hypothetical protein